MSDTMIYLDHAAATPMDRRVLLAMQPYFSEIFFNPSAPYALAVTARHDYEAAKRKLANLMGGKENEVTITAGATESINLAISGLDGHIVTSSIEHQSVLACASARDHTLVEPDSHGHVSSESIRAALRPDTKLVTIALANNELGTIQPLRDIAEVVRSERRRRLSSGNNTPIYLHSDASQGVGQIDINVARLGVDMLTINAGKIYGPKQVGLLWVSSDVKLTPQIVGGGQESGLRSGTENVAGAIGFARALELAQDHRKSEVVRLGKLRDELQDNLTEAFPEAVVSGDKNHRLNSFLNISFPGLDGERLVFLLENRGVMVATGSACSANKGLRSHVLKAIGLADGMIDGSLRISLGHLSTVENTRKAARIMIEEISHEYERVGL